MKYPTILRIDAGYDLKNALILAINQIEPIYQNCLNCMHFDEQREGCKLYHMTRPPARTIAYGCPKWDTDEIPF